MLDYIELMQLILFFFFPVLVICTIYKFLTYIFQKISLTFCLASLISIFCIALYLASVLLPFDPGILFLFSFHQWDISLHIIGLIIPLLLIFILFNRKLFSKTNLVFGIVCNSIISFLITYPIPDKGIVAPFPLWLLPAFFSSLLSIYILDKETIFIKSAYAYCISVLGIIIGADLLHLPQLLSNQPDYTMNAIIGGASMLDLIFITGIITVSIIQLYYALFNLSSSKKHNQDLPVYFLQ